MLNPGFAKNRKEISRQLAHKLGNISLEILFGSLIVLATEFFIVDSREGLATH